jgi:hypothetical protein
VINNLGSNVSRPTGDLANFVGELTKRADANGDGSLTGSEFAQFLTQLVDKSASHTAKSTAHPATPSPMDAIARILETFPRTPEGLKSALPSIQSALPAHRCQDMTTWMFRASDGSMSVFPSATPAGRSGGANQPHERAVTHG